MAGRNSDSNSSPTSSTAAGKRPEITSNDLNTQSHLAPNSHNPRNYLSTSSLDDHDHDVASPPYRPEASTTSLTGQELLLNPNHPYSHYPPSPAYRSQPNMSDEVHLEGDRHATGDAKWEGELRDTKHKVHYPESIDLEPIPVVSGDVSPAANRANMKLEEIPSRDFNRSGTNSPADAISLAGTDDEEDESDYDWSGEDDLVDEEAKFEQQMGVKPKRTGWGFKRIITLLFSSLLGSTLVAGILVTPGILIHFYWYNDNPTSHRKYVEQNVQAWLFWAAANLLLSWYLAVIVDLVPTLATFIIAAAWGHVSEVFKSRVELYNSVKNTFKPVLYAASAWASWVIIFGHIFNLYDTEDSSQSRASYTERLYEVVEFLFFFVLVICAQKMLSHMIAFAFHRTAFKERLDEVQQALKVIEQLRNYRPKHDRFGRQSNRSSGWAWSTPVLEKASFGFGKSTHHKGFSSSRQYSHRTDDDGYGADADNDFDDRTMVGNPSRKSTLGSTFGFSNKGKDKSNRRSGVPAGAGDHELGVFTSTISPRGFSPNSASPDTSRPMTPATSAPFIMNRAASPAGISPSETGGRITPHRYPPGSELNTASPRPSIDSNHGAGDTLAAAAKVLKSAVLHDARNIGGDSDQIANGGGGAIGLGHVGSSAEAKRLARAIYLKFRPIGQGRTYLLPSDFYPAFPDTTTAQAAFRVFDKDNNGDLSRAEIKTTLLKVYKERRFLARSMRDVGIALKSLDQILLFFALVVIFFISLSVFGVQIGDSLSSVYTLGIGASFIFKTSASSAFDAIMFLFVTHPYDTGDRCFIDDEILVVKKMGLFATVFARVDGTETYYFNSQLFSKFITNVRRSGQMYENVTLQLHWRTPIAKLDALEKSLNNWLQTEQNRWFVPSTAIMLQSINFQRYLEVTIGIGHNGTWQDWGLRCARKTAFHAAVQHYTRQLGIVCYESTQPVVYANAPDTPAINVFPEATMPPPSPGGNGGWAGSGYEVETGPDGGIDIIYGDSSAGGGIEPNQSTVSPAAAAALGAGEKESGLKTALGFTPPEGLVGSHLRARKTKSRKVMVGLAGDG
ncbi:Mechanosensitive ion channel-domain-containing protein [Lentinula raphanica]|uniref:Mechanosensitive ion channel-domain-containing protein n=1 Tax=Lentinula raphanica TaxID=153919 RepID=A0AA38PEK3_9AGAR|nr:Mechanosensitive ion channel-domain-containing protein [Lentinula raphanica]KAJ3972480.1 Mechanosensitive ion channel-domain-containing protein [Lentinula raphanica]